MSWPVDPLFHDLQLTMQRCARDQERRLLAQETFVSVKRQEMNNALEKYEAADAEFEPQIDVQILQAFQNRINIACQNRFSSFKEMIIRLLLFALFCEGALQADPICK